MSEELSFAERQVLDLVNKQRKAKINWIITITQLSVNELVPIAEKLKFIIKGEYIALPSEADSIHQHSTWKPLPKYPPRGYYHFPESEFEKSTKSKKSPKTPKTTLEYRFCPNCGIALKDTGIAYYYEGFCQNCGEDLEKMLEEQTSSNPYNKKRCARCTVINPTNARFCYYCGFDILSHII